MAEAEREEAAEAHGFGHAAFEVFADELFIADERDIDNLTDGQSSQKFSKATEKFRSRIYDYVITDSKVERNFVRELDACDDVVVYAKLLKGFHIPTPLGGYNPDWAIAFRERTMKHIYFVAETKGSMSAMQFCALEEKKSNAHAAFSTASTGRSRPIC